MSNYITGEPMVPPSERDKIRVEGPVNWAIRSKCEKMNSEELIGVIREATRILNERENARAKELIKKVCVALNELKEMGNVEFHIKRDFHDSMSDVDFFDETMFKIRGK